MRQVYRWIDPFALIVTWLVTMCMGCSILQRGTWPLPTASTPDPAILRKECSVRFGSHDLAEAEIAYAAAIESMEKGDDACVDDFFFAAKSAWNDMDQSPSESVSQQSRASEIYRSSLNALINEGQKYNRLDPRHGLCIRTTGGWSTVPIIHHGFPRVADDFNELAVVGEYSSKQLKNVYRRHGLGVPVVAIRRREISEPFQHDQQSFAATFVLRTVSNGVTNGDPEQNSTTVLELYDPLRNSDIVNRESCVQLTLDSTAPFARVLSTTKRSYVQSFLQPGLVKPDSEGLFMLEPYQPGKIPVVFIHGLLSDRLTWANMVNEIYARPEFVDRFQLWGFEYPTGEPFLRSAALLRHQLKHIRVHIDPNEKDNALDHLVLVGHSMGGLISKMQITESGDQLWNSLSDRHFEQVVMLPASRRKFAEAVFFKPSPMVSRVIFIGTPHRGSALAQRTIGRVGSLLIEQPAEQKAEHDRLLQDNPNAFSDEFARRVPTSIDLLEPNSKLLQAIDGLSISPCVRLNSIIGIGRWMPLNGDSDGVVPISSAQHTDSLSEFRVKVKHDKLTEDQGVIHEVLAILREHHLQFMNSAD